MVTEKDLLKLIVSKVPISFISYFGEVTDRFVVGEDTYFDGLTKNKAIKITNFFSSLGFKCDCDMYGDNEYEVIVYYD